ncbi:MAG TPA: MFS transporter [Mycobacteriales bacterium]|nr:MFS transporter [Mycobacteriales bacterium]
MTGPADRLGSRETGLAARLRRDTGVEDGPRRPDTMPGVGLRSRDAGPADGAHRLDTGPADGPDGPDRPDRPDTGIADGLGSRDTGLAARLRRPGAGLMARVRGSGDGFDRRLIAPMILGAILNPINSSMIAVSLIPIGIAFGAPPAETAWLVSALYLATATGQPVVGKLVDAYGPRRLFLIGTALAGIAGLLGTLAPNLPVLVASRVLLGFGTCAGYPAAMSLIRRESERTGMESPSGILTLLAASSQTIAVVGPTLGGLLIGLGGWRTIFAVNIPLSLAGIALGLLRLPRATAAERQKSTVDIPGIALFAGMLTALLLFLMELRPDRWWLAVLTLAAAAAFGLRELRVPEPFLDLRVLGSNGPLLATYGRNLLTFIVSYAFLYGFTQWLEDGRRLSPSQAGLVLLPMFLTAIVVTTLTGRRKEVRGKLVAGSTAQLVACGLLLLLGPASGVWLLVLIAVIVGIPQGLNSLANQNALYHQADPDRIGSAAGLLRTFTYLGAIVAAAANAAVFPHGADSAGLHHLAVFALVVSGLLLAASLLDRSLRRI